MNLQRWYKCQIESGGTNENINFMKMARLVHDAFGNDLRDLFVNSRDICETVSYLRDFD